MLADRVLCRNKHATFVWNTEKVGFFLFIYFFYKTALLNILLAKTPMTDYMLHNFTAD